MQDTEPAALPPRTSVKGPSGPELLVGLIQVTIETAPILYNAHLSQVFLTAIPSKAPTGSLRVSLLFPRRPHLSRKSEWSGLVLTFWRPLEGAGIKIDGGRESLPAISLFRRLQAYLLPGLECQPGAMRLCKLPRLAAEARVECCSSVKVTMKVTAGPHTLYLRP